MDNYKALFLIQQIYSTIFTLTNKLQITGDKFCEPLTSRQFMAMVAIIHLPEKETTINNISKKLGTTKQSTKQLINLIEKKGYIITVPSMSDKRAINVKITDRGKEILKVCGESSVKYFAEMSKNFSINEMEVLWFLLKKLYMFDGEKLDGLEEEVNLDLGKDTHDMQIKLFDEFENIRKNNKNEK